MTEKVANADISIYLEIHVHVHQVMFTNVYSCILLSYSVVIIIAYMYSQLLL